jgi:diguanylate cyclase (GGDEF)-like protein
MEHWRLRLTAILEWSVVEKGLIPMVLALPVYAQYLIWGQYTLHRPDHAQLVHADVMQTVMVCLSVMIVGTFLILWLGFWLRRTNPNMLWFQHLSTQYFSISMVTIGYFVGSLNYAAGILTLGAPVFGFIVLHRRVVWLAYGTAIILITTFLTCNALDLLPYAPLVVTDSAPQSLLFWRNTILSFAAPFLLVVTMLADYALASWRKREDIIRILSQTDVLTNLYNRRAILDRLNNEVSRSTRHGHPLVVVLMDLDFFKAINDTWGHPTGDLVLQATARTLKAHLRQNDAVGRYGGEEFILVLPDTDLHGAAVLVERCRVQLANTTMLTDTGIPIQVTASFGLAGDCMDSTSTASLLIQHADQALYRAKHQGRNRIEIATVKTRARSTG